MTADSPRAPQGFFEAGLPILGICYGQQTMCAQLGGDGRARRDHREFGRAFIEIVGRSRAVRRAVGGGRAPSGVDEPWRQGRRAARGLPRRRPFARRAVRGRRRRGAALLRRRSSTPRSSTPPTARKLIANFARHVCGLAGDWTMAEFRATKIAEIRAQVGKGRVICGLSGGVDSRGRGGADPRGDRRAADLRVRRSRADARAARRSRSSACSATTTTSRSSM